MTSRVPDERRRLLNRRVRLLVASCSPQCRCWSCDSCPTPNADRAASSVRPVTVAGGCQHDAVRFVRFEATNPSPSGRHPGVFALVNGLAHDGRLTDEQARWWRANNDWFNATYTDPASVDPSLFDRSVNPVTSCWFKADAIHLTDRLHGYLALLDSHEIGWTELRSDDPGIVVYEDQDQVVVIPRDDPSSGGRSIMALLADGVPAETTSAPEAQRERDDAG